MAHILGPLIESMKFLVVLLLICKFCSAFQPLPFGGGGFRKGTTKKLLGKAELLAKSDPVSAPPLTAEIGKTFIFEGLKAKSSRDKEVLITFTSCQQLTNWARCQQQQTKKFKMANTDVLVGGVAITCEEDFRALSTNVIHHIEIVPQSKLFSTYKSLDMISDYLSVQAIDVVDIEAFEFDDLKTCEEFDCLIASLEESLLAKTKFLSTSVPVEVTGRITINEVLFASMALAENITNPQSSVPSIPKIFVEPERPCVGARARRKFDYLICCELLGIVVLKVKPPKTVSQYNAARYQLAAQLKVMQEETARDIARRYNITQHAAETFLYEFPIYGVICTGNMWIFMQYRLINGVWKLEQNDAFHFDAFKCGNSKGGFKSQLKNVVNSFLGMIVKSVTNAAQLDRDLLNARH